MTAQHVSILEKFAAEAIRLGAQQLEVDYKDGYEELSAVAGDFGFGIGRLRSTSKDADTLRHELYQSTRRTREIVVDGDKYEPARPDVRQLRRGSLPGSAAPRLERRLVSLRPT
jgi:hypothetical protein